MIETSRPFIEVKRFREFALIVQSSRFFTHLLKIAEEHAPVYILYAMVPINGKVFLQLLCQRIVLRLIRVHGGTPQMTH